MPAGMDNMIGVLVQGTDSLSSSLVKAEKSLVGFENEAKKASDEFNEGLAHPKIDTTSIDDAAKKMKDMGQKAMIAGGLIVAGLGFASKSASGFETGMAEVATLVDTSTTDMDALSQTVRGMWKEFGILPVDTAKVLYTTISAGFGDAADATVVMTGAMKLARGGITDAGTAVDGLTSIMNSYGMKSSEVGKVSDQMFVAMKAGKTTIGELSSAMGKVTPLASAAGVGIDQVLSATSALTLGGLKTAEAVTSLRGVFSAVMKPTAEATKVAKELGIQFDVAGLKSLGLSGFLAQVAEKTGGNQEQMAQLFGSVEALSGVLALTGGQAGSFNNILGQMQTSLGATDEAYAKVEATSGMAFDRAKVALEEMKVSIGSALAPVVEGLAAAFSSVSTWVSDLYAKHPFLTKLVTVFIAVSGAILLIGGAALVMAAKVTTAMAAVNVSTGGVILIIGALVTGITALVMWWTSGTDEMGESTSALGGVFSWFGDFFAGVVQGIMAVVNTLGSTIVSVFSFAGNSVIAIWTTVSGVFSSIWTGFTDIIVGFWSYLVGLKDSFFEAGVGFITAIWDGIVSVWTGVMDGITGLFGQIRDMLPFSDAKTGPLSTLTKSGRAFMSTFASGIDAAAIIPRKAMENALMPLGKMLPHSDAQAGPLMSTTALGASSVSLAVPKVPSMHAFASAPDQTRGQAAQAPAGAQVTFQSGAIQITVSSASEEDMDDLESRISEIFERAALRMGGVHV